MKAHVEKYGIPMLYCNTVGAQTEVVFDGGSLVYNVNGQLVKECKYFEEDEGIFDLDELSRKEGTLNNEKLSGAEKEGVHVAASLPNGEDQGAKELESKKSSFYYSAS